MLNYSLLREIQKKEIESFEPVKVDKDFYAQLRQFLELKKSAALKSQSLMDMRELENVKKVAKSIMAKRKEKLLMLSSLSEGEVDGLTDEEQAFLRELRRISSDSFGPLECIFEEPRDDHSRMRLKVVKTIDAYKGFDNNIYGPFKEGEEITLPEEEAELLLKSKMAEHIY
ncbi:MAG: DNA replication complex GINS family protein [Candidatus ainarchaeum sp.]|nr:DNA replication complex GINS family protein [Candidatus ainarchaeum sp.]